MSVTLNGTNGLTFNDGSSQATAAKVGMVNRIINGGMVIDQRNAGASVTPASGAFVYNVDRWGTYQTQASKITVQQNAGSVTPPAGFSNYVGVTSSSAYSVISSDQFLLEQAIEANNVFDFSYGTANAQTVTVSFWVRSSLTGTFAGCLRNYAGTRSYPFTYTISSSNTWEQKSITITGDTSGTWVTSGSGGSMYVIFNLGSGSTYLGTAGAWAAGNYTSVSGSVNIVGTSGATFYITGVQLEKGSTATSFDYRPYGTELQLAQRYYAKTFGQSTAPAQAVGSIAGALAGFGQNASVGPAARFQFPVVMRAAPSTVTTYSPFQSDANWRESSNATSNTAVVGTALDSGVVITSSTQTGTNYFYIHVTANAEL